MKELWQTFCLCIWGHLKERFIYAETFLPGLGNTEAPSAPRTSMPERDVFGELSHMLFMLGIVFIVLLGLSWASKRFLARRMQSLHADSNIQVLETRPLSMKSTLYIIEVEGKRLLVGESSTEVRLLGKLDSLGRSAHVDTKQFDPL